MGCSGGKAAGTSKAEEDNLNFLSRVALFQRLPKSEYPVLCKSCQVLNYNQGSVIIRQGDVGDAFFVIKKGKAEVSIDGKKVAQLSAGEYFGEAALIRDEPRTATIKAETMIEALKITRASFDKLGLSEKLEFVKRGAVACGGSNQVAIKAPSSKTDPQRELMKKALKDNTNLTSMVPLDDAKMNAIIDLMWKETCRKGTQVIVQGNLDADYFYIVQEGKFEVSIETNGKVQKPLVLAKGASFGELALMYLAPRQATVEALEDAVLWLIDRGQFKEILVKDATKNAAEYIKYLDKVELLNDLKDEEKELLANALVDKAFHKGETIFNQGEPGDYFYMLIEGAVSVAIDGQEKAVLNAAKGVQFFGEMALLRSEGRMATVTVTSELVRCLAVDKASFDMILGPLEALKSRGKNGVRAIVKRGETTPFAPGKQFGKIFRKDLRKIALLGCGGFGAVELVEHVPTGETYALKALSKGYIIKSGMQASVMSEKNVQLRCDSPFVIQLYETYNGDQSLFLLLELALGGELYATYNKKRLWGREDCALYYVAGTTFAFEHLHSKKILYRDLKPENLLLNDRGHVKLTDMGLAKICPGKTYTTCGTPDYFAPELIASKGHTIAVDWWCLGILTFELLAGVPPFESPTPVQIYQKVAKGISKVIFPKPCKGAVESLIRGLCNQVPSERLPMKKGGTDNIKQHPWYTGFEWDDIFEGTMEPPYKPVVKEKKDHANFNARKEDMPPQIFYKDPGTGWDKDFATST